MTPEEMLLKAVKERHYNGVKRAFERNANVNAVDDAGWTCLHYAAYHGFDEIVDVLLSHDAIDPTLRTPQGQTARDLAFIACHDNIVQMLDASRSLISHLSRTPDPKATRVEAVTSTKGRQRSLFS